MQNLSRQNVKENQHLFRIKDISINSMLGVPGIKLNKYYTDKELDELFVGLKKSYFANSIQYYCNNFSIIFQEM
jgi:hypothetical protein